jgi:hypothetical protein
MFGEERPRGTSWHRWEDNTEIDVKEAEQNIIYHALVIISPHSMET